LALSAAIAVFVDDFIGFRYWFCSLSCLDILDMF